MEFRQLRYFVAVAEELHFGRAAERVNVAQPAVSYQVKRLESELGVLLLERNNRKVRLTEAGQVFLDKARLIIEQTQQAAALTSMTGAGQAGRLGIGFVASSALYFLPEVLHEFRGQFPNVDLTLYQISSGEQVRAFRDGRISIGLVRGPILAEDLETTVLFAEPLIVALHANHPLAANEKIDVHDLASETFVAFDSQRDFTAYDAFIRLCQSDGFTPRLGHHTYDLLGVLVLVAAGIGLAIVSASTAQIQFPGIVFRPLSKMPPVLEHSVAIRRNETSPTALGLLRVLKEWRAHKVNVA